MTVTTVTITPDTEINVLSLADAKLQLRLEDSYTEEDSLIESYIKSAVSNVENYLNGHIQPKELVISFSSFTDYEFDTYPISSISVAYYKANETDLTDLPVTDWHTVSANPKHTVIVIDKVPYNVAERPDAVVITANIGYTDPETIPAPIIQAIKLQVSDMFERREDRAGIAVKVSQTLLRPFRNYL